MTKCMLTRLHYNKVFLHIFTGDLLYQGSTVLAFNFKVIGKVIGALLQFVYHFFGGVRGPYSDAGEEPKLKYI